MAVSLTGAGGGSNNSTIGTGSTGMPTGSYSAPTPSNSNTSGMGGLLGSLVLKASSVVPIPNQNNNVLSKSYSGSVTGASKSSGTNATSQASKNTGIGGGSITNVVLTGNGGSTVPTATNPTGTNTNGPGPNMPGIPAPGLDSHMIGGDGPANLGPGGGGGSTSPEDPGTLTGMKKSHKLYWVLGIAAVIVTIIIIIIARKK